MKENKNVETSHLVKKPHGKLSNQEFNNAKFQKRSDLIMDMYKNPNLTEDQMYLVDKVVRMRGKSGRFGVDHSEILNYELELANKARDKHMNQLVYKDPDGNETVISEDQAIQKFPGDMSTS